MGKQILHSSNLRTMKSGGAITQYYFVKLSADDTVIVCAAATDKPYGIAQVAASAANEYIQIAVSGRSKVSSDAALTIGLLVGPSADGQADSKVPATDDNEYYCGVVTKASGAAGEIAEVELFGMVYLDKNT